MINMIEKILDADIYTYRLTDGSYIVAEEVDIEESTEYSNTIFVTLPAQIVYTEEGYHIVEWNLSSLHDLTELNADNIVSRSEALFELKAHYFKYILLNKERQDERDDTMLSLLEMDNLDEAFLNDFDKQDLNEHIKRWDWKPGNN
jgi:hypothetical protein